MRDQVDLREARYLHIPVIGLERDVMFEQGARLGAPVEPPSQLRFVGAQAVIEGASADGQQLTLQLRG